LGQILLGELKNKWKLHPLDLKTQNVTSQKTRNNNKPEGELGVRMNLN
jgi:hypothetical protein